MLLGMCHSRGGKEEEEEEEGGGKEKERLYIYIPSLHSCQSAIRIHIQKNSESDQQGEAVNETW